MGDGVLMGGEGLGEARGKRKKKKKREKKNERGIPRWPGPWAMAKKACRGNVRLRSRRMSAEAADAGTVEAASWRSAA